MDGQPFPPIQSNIKDDADFPHLKGQEVGLFRLEGLYSLLRPLFAYLIRLIKKAISLSPTINLRLFDIAMDKLPAFFTSGDSAAVGRTKGGIDFLLHTKMGRSILDEQLRAVLIAYDRLLHTKKSGIDKKTVRLILPMVSNPDEIREFKEIFSQIEKELMGEIQGKKQLVKQRPDGDRISNKIKIGAMIETSAAVANIEEIAEAVDYFAIGGNDLTRDLLGVGERIKLMTGPQYDWLSPIVLRNIQKVINVAKAHHIPVGSSRRDVARSDGGYFAYFDGDRPVKHG